MQGREDTYQQQGMSNFERLIQQLGSYQSSHTAGHGGIDSPYGARRGSDASVGAAMGGTNGTAVPPHPVVSPLGEMRQKYDTSPVRPDYSPLSNAGGTPRPRMPPEPTPMPPQLHGLGIGGEGWRT